MPLPVEHAKYVDGPDLAGLRKILFNQFQIIYGTQDPKYLVKFTLKRTSVLSSVS